MTTKTEAMASPRLRHSSRAITSSVSQDEYIWRRSKVVYRLFHQLMDLVGLTLILPNSAQADGNPAEIKEKIGKMVEHTKF